MGLALREGSLFPSMHACLTRDRFLLESMYTENRVWIMFIVCILRMIGRNKPIVIWREGLMKILKIQLG